MRNQPEAGKVYSKGESFGYAIFTATLSIIITSCLYCFLLGVSQFVASLAAGRPARFQLVCLVLAWVGVTVVLYLKDRGAFKKEE